MPKQGDNVILKNAYQGYPANSEGYVLYRTNGGAMVKMTRKPDCTPGAGLSILIPNQYMQVGSNCSNGGKPS
jgi:hypothetical protein